MPTRTGGINTKNYNDPAYLAQAESIGARVDPKTGKWYDKVDGHFIDQNEANRRTQAAGTAVTYNYDRGGLAGMYDRNDDWVDPALAIGASLINPALGAAVAAGTNYGKTHDLGKAAVAGVTNYGLSKAGSLLGKIPGVGSAGKAIAQLPGVSTVTDLGKKIADSPLGETWDKNVAQPIQDATHGLKLPGIGAIGDLLGKGVDFATGNNGLNALAIAQGLNAANLGRKSADYADRALDTSESLFKSKEPLRQKAIGNLMNPTPNPALPGIAAIRKSASPFARVGG